MEALLPVIAGTIGVPVVNWIKNKLGLEDSAALIFVAIPVSAVLAVGAMFLNGQLGIADFSLAQLPATITAVFSVATVIYGLIKNRD